MGANRSGLLISKHWVAMIAWTRILTHVANPPDLFDDQQQGLRYAPSCSRLIKNRISTPHIVLLGTVHI